MVIMPSAITLSRYCYIILHFMYEFYGGRNPAMSVKVGAKIICFPMLCLLVLPKKEENICHRTSRMKDS